MSDNLVAKFLNFVRDGGAIKDNVKGIIPVRYKDMGDGTFAEVISLGTNIDLGDVQLVAGENHIGEVGGSTSYVDVALTTDTAIYTNGDVLFLATNIAGAMRANNKRGILQSIVVIDEDDQGVAMDLVFMSATQTLGTINVAPSISDAGARDILGIISILSSDYVDLGGVRVASKNGLGMVVRPVTGATNLYVAGITRGTPTHTVSGLRLRLGFLQD